MEKKRLIVATGNAHKMEEIRQIMKDLPLELVTMKEAGADLDIEETGTTFEENAVLKARAVAKASGEMAVADDSGLVVDALDGAPGIMSARFMGHDTSYEVKNRVIVEQVNLFCRKHAGIEENFPDRPGCEKDGTPGPLRSARFVCAAAVAFPDGSVRKATGVMEGRISYGESGANGFGYDPIFFLPEYGMTSADISPEEKNRISHRGKAFEGVRRILEEM